MPSNDLVTLVRAIVSGQQVIIGPLAIEQANKVSGIKVSSDLNAVTVSGDSKELLNKLVKQYEQLFGKASIEACRDAVKKVMPSISPSSVPDFLK